MEDLVFHIKTVADNSGLEGLQRETNKAFAELNKLKKEASSGINPNINTSKLKEQETYAKALRETLKSLKGGYTSLEDTDKLFARILSNINEELRIETSLIQRQIAVINNRIEATKRATAANEAYARSLAATNKASENIPPIGGGGAGGGGGKGPEEGKASPLKRLVGATKQAVISAPIYGAAYAGLGALTGAVSEFVDMDKTLNRIAIVTDKTTESVREMRNQFSEAGKALGTTGKEFAEGSLIFYQQGGKAAEFAKELTTASIQLSNATGKSARDTSDYVTAIANSFKMLDQGEAGIQKISDSLLYLDKATGASADEIGEAMKRSASVFSSAGIDMQQAGAMIATVLQTTRLAPERVGTAFKTILENIQMVQDAGPKSMQDFTNKIQKTVDMFPDLKGKLQFFDEKGQNLKPVKEILKDVQDVYTSVKDTDPTAAIALAEAIGGKENANVIQSLLENQQLYAETLEGTQKSQGTAAKAQAEYMKSVAAHIGQLKADWEEFVAKLVTSDALNGIIDGLKKALGAISMMLGDSHQLLKILSVIGGLYLFKNFANLKDSYNEILKTFSKQKTAAVEMAEQRDAALKKELLREEAITAELQRQAAIQIEINQLKETGVVPTGLGKGKKGKYTIGQKLSTTDQYAQDMMGLEGELLSSRNTVAALEADAPTITKTGKLAKAGRFFGKAGKLVKGGGLITLATGGLAIAGDMAEGKGFGEAATGQIGNIGGGLAGAAAGAAIGSVVPIIGTAIGGIVGGILGSMGGTKLQDMITKGAEENPELKKAKESLISDQVSSFKGNRAHILELQETFSDYSGKIGLTKIEQDKLNSATAELKKLLPDLNKGQELNTAELKKQVDYQEYLTQQAAKKEAKDAEKGIKSTYTSAKETKEKRLGRSDSAFTDEEVYQQEKEALARGKISAYGAEKLAKKDTTLQGYLDTGYIEFNATSQEFQASAKGNAQSAEFLAATLESVRNGNELLKGSTADLKLDSEAFVKSYEEHLKQYTEANHAYLDNQIAQLGEKFSDTTEQAAQFGEVLSDAGIDAKYFADNVANNTEKLSEYRNALEAIIKIKEKVTDAQKNTVNVLMNGKSTEQQKNDAQAELQFEIARQKAAELALKKGDTSSQQRFLKMNYSKENLKEITDEFKLFGGNMKTIYDGIATSAENTAKAMTEAFKSQDLKTQMSTLQDAFKQLGIPDSVLKNARDRGISLVEIYTIIASKLAMISSAEALYAQLAFEVIKNNGDVGSGYNIAQKVKQVYPDVDFKLEKVNLPGPTIGGESLSHFRNTGEATLIAEASKALNDKINALIPSITNKNGTGDEGTTTTPSDISRNETVVELTEKKIAEDDKNLVESIDRQISTIEKSNKKIDDKKTKIEKLLIKRGEALFRINEAYNQELYSKKTAMKNKYTDLKEDTYTLGFTEESISTTRKGLEEEYQKKIDAYNAAVDKYNKSKTDANKKITETAKAAMTTSKNALDAFNKSIDKTIELAGGLQKARDDVESFFNTVREKLQQLTKESMDKSLSNILFGVDSIQKAKTYFDTIMAYQKEFLDKQEKGLEFLKLEQKIKDDLATGGQNKQILNFETRINELKKSDLHYSQEEFDLLNAEYDVLQKEIAAKRMSNAQEELKLMRDEQGNWLYVYSQDTDKARKASEDLTNSISTLYSKSKSDLEATGSRYFDILSQISSLTSEIATTTDPATLERLNKQKDLLTKSLKIEQARFEREKNSFEIAAALAGLQTGGPGGKKYIDQILAAPGKSLEQIFGKTLPKEIQSIIAPLRAKGGFEDQLQLGIGSAITSAQKTKAAIDTFNRAILDGTKAFKLALVEAIGKSKGLTEVTDKSGKGIGVFKDSKGAYSTINISTGQSEARDIGTLIKNNISKFSSLNTAKPLTAAQKANTKEYGINKGQGYYKIQPTDTLESIAQKSGRSKDEIVSILFSKISAFATGGYTGNFDGGKLAVLHGKELVLNKADTQNILSAVSITRDLASILTNSVSSLIGTVNKNTNNNSSTIINASFPNVSSSEEIRKAFANMSNNASQFAYRLK